MTGDARHGDERPIGSGPLTRSDDILSQMRPRLAGGEVVFVSLPGSVYGDHAQLAPVVAVQEEEGLTLVVLRERADAAGLDYDGAFRQITLGAHSSLHAVGLTAAVAGRLAALGVSANVVAGAHHDHLFVPTDRADEALAALR